MTTIACNHKVMAGDSLCDDGGMRAKAVKIFDIDGDFLGIAGSLAQGLKFVSWYKSREGEPPCCDETTILVLSKGKIFTWENGGCIPVAEKFYSIGSGAHAAMAAMICGKAPDEAVKVACKVDIGSGLPIRTLKRE